MPIRTILPILLPLRPSADLCFTCAIVVQDLCEDSRVTVEEIFVKYAVVVGLHIGETSQSRGGNLLQRRAVDLMPNTSNVHTNPVTCHRHAHTLFTIISSLRLPLCITYGRRLRRFTETSSAVTVKLLLMCLGAVCACATLIRNCWRPTC